jgi:lipoprotein-releasing system permease protein
LNVALYIARRHLFARKTRGIINFISGISMVVVAFITAAMITVMSAFNGIDELVKAIFSNVDAPLTVLPAEGKVIPDSLINSYQPTLIPGVIGYSKVIEEDVRLSHENRYAIATVKGVESNYADYSPIDTAIVDGQYLLQLDSLPLAVVGSGIQIELDMPLREYAPTIMEIAAPIRGRRVSQFKDEAFNQETIAVSGVFAINAELDAKYTLVPLWFARKLFEMSNEVSSVDVFTDEKADVELIKQTLVSSYGPTVRVITREEKNALIYKTNASEKWATFMILLFIFLIGCFNIIASLTMLIIEKKRDIFTLNSMGVDTRGIKRIFIFEGVMINLIGALAGCAIGLALCFVQERYGLIAMTGGAVESYPVSVKWLDVLGILATVISVGALFSILLVRSLVHRFASNAMMSASSIS